MKKWVNRVLALLFLTLVFSFFFVSMFSYARNYASGFLVYYKSELPKNPSLFDNISARIAKLEERVAYYYAFKNTFLEICAGFQYNLGKRMLRLGSADMVTLNTGDLYDLMPNLFPMEELDKVVALNKAQKDNGGVPVLFVYAHATLYEEDMLPDGFEYLDQNIVGADTLTSVLTDNGIPVVDSRDVYKASGLTLRDFVNRTDQHWTHRAALETARSTVAALNKEFGFAFDETALDMRNMHDDVYEKLLLGEYGQRIGKAKVEPDDIHLFYPAYDTYLEYKSVNGDAVTERKGTFRETVIEDWKLARTVDGCSISAYYVYGDYIARTFVHNPSAPEGSVLVFKDSYGTPVAGFLSLCCRDVAAVDLRNSEWTMQEWIDFVKPDAVVFVYSQQMLRKLNYVVMG